mgnify:CR=1 FL=1
MKVDPNAGFFPDMKRLEMLRSINVTPEQKETIFLESRGIPIRLAIAAQIMAGFAANSCLSETWIAEGRTVSEMANDAQSWADALIAAHNEDSK